MYEIILPGPAPFVQKVRVQMPFRFSPGNLLGTMLQAPGLDSRAANVIVIIKGLCIARLLYGVQRAIVTSFRLNLRSPKAFRTWRVNSSTPNARELTDDGGGQMGAAPLDPGERSVNSGVLVAAVAGLGDPEPLPKSAGT